MIIRNREGQAILVGKVDFIQRFQKLLPNNFTTPRNPGNYLGNHKNLEKNSSPTMTTEKVDSNTSIQSGHSTELNAADEAGMSHPVIINE